MPPSSIITLTTDFGVSDHFVGTMKGVILSINPAARIIDISHQVNSHDVFDAAFTLFQAYRYFPPDTIHMAVVDPGVGTARRPVIARSGRYTFVAPDNGVLSLIYEEEESIEVREITASHYFLSPMSHTFHGRDVFSPVAAWLSKGVEVAKFGDPVTDFVRFVSPKPKPAGDQRFQGVVLKVDKFGNLITNFSARQFPALLQENLPAFRLSIGQHHIEKLSVSFADGQPGELLAMVGSSGFVEICANRGSAAKLLQANRGAEAILTLGTG
ncbi:MAG TPA: SAM-dependent chlorinase/fluorinase [Terriglobia bacterium]|nr:SAM-dependent chlorinase/fluorinase [Terriglobia bacterium]